MKHHNRFIYLLRITAFVALALHFNADFMPKKMENQAFAAEQSRKSYSIKKRTFRQLNKIERAYATGDKERALQLAIALEKKNLTPYGEVQLWQWMAILRQDEAPDAVVLALKNALLAARKIHPESLETKLLYSLSQGYFELGNYDIAMLYFKEWAPKDKIVKAPHLAYIAQLYYMLKSYKNAAKYIDDAISELAAGQHPKQRKLWLDIAISAHWETKNYKMLNYFIDKKQTHYPDDSNSLCEIRAAIEMIVANKLEHDAIAHIRSTNQSCMTLSKTNGPVMLEMTESISTVMAENEDSEGCLPIVRISARYPRRAWERKIQGYVIVSMNAKDDGWIDPKSVTVLEAQPKGYFEKSAISSASKMRYKSKLIHGTSGCETGLTYRFTFNLAN